jgi:hypothetical protein
MFHSTKFDSPKFDSANIILLFLFESSCDSYHWASMLYRI